MKARNITDIQAMPDGSYVCRIELFDDWNGTWGEVPYTARQGDPAPMNCYILSEIATGNYVVTQWTAPEAANPPSYSEGPTVI